MSPRAVFLTPKFEPRWPALLLVVALVAASAWIESCAVMRKVGLAPAVGDDAMKFSHAKHAAHTPDCKTCHASKDDGAIGKATHASCVECHAAAVDDKEADNSCLLCHHTLTPKAPRRAERPDYSKATFDHAAHEKTSCETCHGQVAKGKMFGGEKINFPRMEECVACHFPAVNEVSSTDCFTCHMGGLDAKAAPPSHKKPGWKDGVHGPASNEDPALCARCHVKAQDCASCHQIERPKSHNAAFRAKLHGFHARNNPTSCEVCHTQEFCEACHRTTQPQSHTASFKDRPWLHCATCHLPLDDGNTCSVCHHGDPHEKVFATPPPPDLVADGSINLHHSCLPCHPVHEVPIPHPYNTIEGTECIVCHRPL